jgi:hypothetical protein
LFQVLTAIQFDDEFLLDADEVGDVVADGVLTPEGDAHSVVAEVRPEFAFGGGGFFAEFDGAGSGF